MASVPHNLSAPTGADVVLPSRDKQGTRPGYVSRIEATIRTATLIVLGGVSAYVAYDRITNDDYYAKLSEIERNTANNERPTIEFVMKAIPELKVIEHDLSEAKNDPKKLQDVLQRLEKLWMDMPDKISPPFKTASHIRMMLGQTHESLGNLEDACRHFGYAAHYAEQAELPEVTWLKEKNAQLSAKLPSMEERLRQLRETHGPLSTDAGEMEERLRQWQQKTEPPVTVGGGGE